jgi:hypothetical protein
MVTEVMRKTLIVLMLSLLTVRIAAQRTVVRADPGDRESLPIFIAVSELVTPEGDFSPSIPQEWRKMMSGYGRAEMAPRDRGVDASPSLPCGGNAWFDGDVENIADMSSPQSTLRSAKGVFRGRIASITSGFFFGSPGSLLELSDVHTLKRSHEYGTVRDRLYVRHPYAHFRIGLLEFCKETQAGGHVPAVGEELMIVTFDAPLDNTGTFVYSTVAELIFESEGRLQMPEFLRPLAGDSTSLRGMANRLGEMLKRDVAARDRQ